ncbi:coiled-coil domain-containing protein 117 [Microcaecilia unicolor]|uniref:Coiled-coil domain-containing protein 117-like n=1 Tax=Microcaecilia unicolor TaxID=1415580 RepID=A0A6P7Z7M1_9AMPH|nr:coiled-coil domain-containing protein 117-like [Microcaecilia unicolor]
MAGGGNGGGYFDVRERPYLSPPVANAGTFGGGGGVVWAGARIDCGSAARLTPALSSPGISGHCARKHKREEAAEDEDSPVRKKRPTEALCSPSPVSESCDPSTRQKMLGEVLNQYNSLPADSVLQSPFEEMEQTAWEQQCEAAQRKLKEIEDRLIDEDEVVEADHSVSSLPTLVLSDALKNGLKRELNEDLTKKIVECMSRPSMELVLWKPPSDFLTDNLKAVAKKYKQEVVDRIPKPITPAAVFQQQQQTEPLSEIGQSVASPSPYANLETTWCTEEEMEL